MGIAPSRESLFGRSSLEHRSFRNSEIRDVEHLGISAQSGLKSNECKRVTFACLLNDEAFLSLTRINGMTGSVAIHPVYPRAYLRASSPFRSLVGSLYILYGKEGWVEKLYDQPRDSLMRLCKRERSDGLKKRDGTDCVRVAIN